jgi:hypothetical protein
MAAARPHPPNNNGTAILPFGAITTASVDRVNAAHHGSKSNRLGSQPTATLEAFRFK